MKALGIVLIVAGIAMLLFRGISFTQKKEVVDLGSVEINRKEKKEVNWPLYTGAIITLAGILVTVSANKK
jgi:uncharacterized membrane protein YdcZ (DUF606 family)